ncbi:MAG: type II secretion system F family protein [archaeon]
MNFFEKYRAISGRFFNSYVEKNLESYKNIHHDLRLANINIMLREYISICYFTLFLVMAVSIPSLLVIFLLMEKGIVLSLLLASGIGLGISFGSFVVALKYPMTKADERKRSIENNLPFAVLYMNTIAGTGSPPYLIFKLLTEFKEYGEVSVEAQRIVEEVEIMGQDIEVAMQRTADETPSKQLRDLLWGMITTIVGGGDLKALLKEEASFLMNDYRRRMEEYTNTLTMYVEVYITLVIVGSIFGLVMSTIMGTISGFAGLRVMQELLVFVFLPIASIVFIMLLKVTSPIS